MVFMLSRDLFQSSRSHTKKWVEQNDYVYSVKKLKENVFNEFADIIAEIARLRIKFLKVYRKTFPSLCFT